MPPKPPTKKPTKQPRCAYVEGGKRCPRAGTGNPALCEPHRIVLEEEASRPTRPGERFVGMLGRVLRGQKVSDDQLFGGIEDLVGVFSQPQFEQARAAARAKVNEWTGVHRGQQQRQAPPPRPPKPKGPDPKAYVVLGFQVGQKLTPDEVKKRHRELARKHHPDRGGSVAKMQEINAAVDQLLASM